MFFENYQLYRLAIGLVFRLPQWFFFFVAGTIAEINFIFSPRSRRGVYTNQAHALPPDTADSGAGAALRGLSLLRLLRRRLFPHSADEPAEPGSFIAGVDGWEHLRAAMNTGKGGIFVTVHMGSWELGGAYMGMRGVPLTTGPRCRTKTPASTRFSLRADWPPGWRLYRWAGHCGSWRMLWRAGGLFGWLPIAMFSGQTHRLPFFGEGTACRLGTFRWRSAPARGILPVCIYRQPDGRSFIEVRPPIIPDPAMDTPEGSDSAVPVRS